jgi:predicted DNA-binding protein (MmcQ/YjbR family)
MNREAVLGMCRGLRGATEGYPFGDGALVFKVSGRMFAIVIIDEGLGSVSLKCDPGYAVALREQHAAVTAGYHLDKRHWNTVQLDGSVPASALGEWIQDSYDLVVASLTRAQRAALGYRDRPWVAPIERA